MTNPFKAIAISLIPNYRFSDVWLAIKLIFQPWIALNRNPQDQLKNSLSKYLGQDYIHLFDSGRTALYFLLQAIDIQPEDEIIMQAFTCSVVPASIMWTGAVPIFVDIDKTLNLDPDKLIKNITPKTKAVIIQHTFGTPANIEKIAAICKKHKLILIEDCAHGLGNSYKGKKLGSFGQISFYSFGRDKVISGIWGGAISTNNETIYQNLNKLTSQLPRHPLSWIYKQLFYIPAMYKIIHTYGFLKLGKVMHHYFRRWHLLSDAITPAEKKAKKPLFFYQSLPSPICLLILSQLKKIDSIIQHRQHLAHVYSKALKTKFDPSCSYIRYSIEVNDPNSLRRFAASKNIFLGDWYSTVIAPKDIDPTIFKYKLKSCPQAEKLTQKIVNLPTNPNLSQVDASKVINIINQWKSEKS